MIILDPDYIYIEMTDNSLYVVKIDSKEEEHLNKWLKDNVDMNKSFEPNFLKKYLKEVADELFSDL